jgi:hypothetical protein
MRFYISAPFFKAHFILFAFSVMTLLLLTACGGGGGGGGEGGIAGVVGLSQHGSTNSHTDSRRGDNCLKSGCHATGGAGTGIFITAGTATSAIGGYIEYYSSNTLRDNSTLVAKLQVDANGNFYTVTAFPALTPDPMSGFSTGAYVTVVTANGARRNMSGIISHTQTSAGCNNCHRVGDRGPL